MISAIGSDDLGEKLIDYLTENDINTTYIQTLNNYKTGEVKVILNEKGSATYEIMYPRS